MTTLAEGRAKAMRKIKTMRKLGAYKDTTQRGWPKGYFGSHPAGSPELQELASKGGKKLHALGKAHRFTPEEARAAALKMQANRKPKEVVRIDVLLRG